MSIKFDSLQIGCNLDPDIRTLGALKCAMNAVLNILMKIAAEGVRAPEAPTEPNLGRRAATLSAPKTPVAVYALPRYRMAIARAV